VDPIPHALDAPRHGADRDRNTIISGKLFQTMRLLAILASGVHPRFFGPSWPED
jgi:hypothetical protein